MTSAPIERSHSVSHAPLNPVCPVTSTRRPFQKPGSTLMRASRRSPSSPWRPAVLAELLRASLDTVTSFTGWSGRNASGPTSPVVLAEPISLPVPGSGLPPPALHDDLVDAGLQVVDAQRHVVAGVGLLPLHVADLLAVDGHGHLAPDGAAQVDRVVAVDRQLDLAGHLTRRAGHVVRRLGNPV